MVQESCRGSVTLVLGGVRSGKSRYGQRLAERSDDVVFVATAQEREDEEMRLKIARHRSDRPEVWRTIEEPLALGDAIDREGSRCEVLLIDCLTMFAANLLEREPGLGARAEDQMESLCKALGQAPCRVVLISNEVGSGVVPAFALGRQYRDLLGEINQRVAAIADEVVLMVAGLPLVLKSAAAGVTSVSGGVR